MMRDVNVRSDRQPLFAGVVFLLYVSLLCGLVECVLITARLATTNDPFHWIPWRVWVYVPLVWLTIGLLVAVPVSALWRGRATSVGVAILIALGVGCRVALFSRKWAILVVAATFVLILAITSRLVLPRLRRAHVWLGVLLLVAGTGVAVTAMQSRSQPQRSPRAAAAADAPNVLLIFADTLRYDAVFAADGHVKPELRNLRQLANSSVVYDRAYSASSWTVPSHFAAITGLDAHQTGLDFDHQKFERPVTTLAERFRRAGYRTAAVLSNPFLHEESGFARGFDSFDHAGRILDICRTAPLAMLGQVWPRFAGTVCGWSGSQVRERALRSMQDAGTPWMVVLNVMEAHEPSYLEPHCRKGAPRRHNTLRTLKVRDAGLYHAAVRCLDTALGPLLERVDQSDRPTVVIFTADHGEHLWERGLVGHGFTLHREVLHVPLIVRTPDKRVARIVDPVSTRQIPELLMSDAFSIAPPPAVASTLTTSSRHGSRRMISMIRGPWQLITTERAPEQLLDLRTGVRAPTSPLLSQLRADTAAIQRAWPRLAATEFKSLGYIQ
jgi:hypothetical protein